MAVGFASYEIPRSGMFVSERGLYVTGHNIANANTPGYVRQQAMITTEPYQTENGRNQFGMGANIQQIRQIRHTFLDNLYRQESTTLGYWESRQKTFQDVQSILGEPMGAGLQNVMNQFWDSWQELSKAPDSLTVRALVRQRGEALVHQINHMGAQIDKLQKDLNSEIQVRIDEVNQITSRIAKLNVEILKVEVSGDTANDYRDQRNTLIDRLSGLVNADVNEMQDSQLAITLGGYFLVNKDVSTDLYAEESQAGGLFYVPKLTGSGVEVTLKSGIIKGLMESRGEVSGASGSFQNGSPDTKADITFVIDLSNGSAGYLPKIQASINNYVNELQKRGIDYNLRLVTYGAAAILNPTVWTNANVNSFITAVNGLAENAADNANNFGGAGGVVQVLNGISDFRTDAGKYAVVFSAESIDGNETATGSAAGYINTLNAKGIKTSVVTDSVNSGFGGEAANWKNVTDGTGGKQYDITSANYNSLMTTINDGINSDINAGISIVPLSDNIIPDLRKRLNALIDIMAREVNYLHGSGKTMNPGPGNNGQDFFTAVNPLRAIEMGNIKLNDNLKSLNNIVASASGANGDNTVALDIANLRHVPLMKDISGILSMDDYYQTIILDVGNKGADSQRISENQQKLAQSADVYRQSITGVSMDEEMTNMMKYQFSYGAASRAINVIDEMIETIVTRMGHVGR